MKKEQRDKARWRLERSPEMQDARPLIKAILLGITLAGALTAAAAMANQDLETKMSDPNNVGRLQTSTQTSPSKGNPHP